MTDVTIGLIGIAAMFGLMILRTPVGMATLSPRDPSQPAVRSAF